jgi:putative membrane protein
MNNKDQNDSTQQYILAEERTLLASERTFSAWIRTALTAMAGGLGILRLIVFKTALHKIIAHVIGEVLILWGGLIIILSAMDHKRTRDRLNIPKTYKSSKLGFTIVLMPLLIISVLLVWVTLP